MVLVDFWIGSFLGLFEVCCLNDCVVRVVDFVSVEYPFDPALAYMQENRREVLGWHNKARRVVAIRFGLWSFIKSCTLETLHVLMVALM